MKGSPALASRRGRSSPEATGAHPSEVVDGTFAPLSPMPPLTLTYTQRSRGIDVDALRRRLWQAVILAAVLNVVLIVALLITRGEIPGVWTSGVTVGPGASVRIAGAGLVAREAPDTSAAIVADLPEGGTVQITGEPVTGDNGMWWPVLVETDAGVVNGYVPESWVQAR
jgi:hypothetical protein